jgi:hypothetical protein
LSAFNGRNSNVRCGARFSRGGCGCITGVVGVSSWRSRDPPIPSLLLRQNHGHRLPASGRGAIRTVPARLRHRRSGTGGRDASPPSGPGQIEAVDLRDRQLSNVMNFRVARRGWVIRSRWSRIGTPTDRAGAQKNCAQQTRSGGSLRRRRGLSHAEPRQPGRYPRDVCRARRLDGQRSSSSLSALRGATSR